MENEWLALIDRLQSQIVLRNLREGIRGQKVPANDVTAEERLGPDEPTTIGAR